MRVCVYTLGCRLNQCESEAIADSFVKEGFEIVGEQDGADLYIVNTCTVTSKAEQKARRMIRRFAQSSPTLVTGCYAQLNREELESLGKEVLVVPLDGKARLLKLAAHLQVAMESSFSLFEGMKSFTGEDATVFDYAAATFSYHSRAYLKIQDGCDNSCAYCRVHVARGKAQSLDRAIVIERAKALEEAGFNEIMLTGVNLTMYDHRNEGLGGLLEALLRELGNLRIRLSSMEPDHIDERLLGALEDPRMQPHFHIPVQSGSDSVLKRVGRKYTIAELTAILDRLKTVKDDPFLAADVITGLPGEGEREFEETYMFLKEIGFSALHVFPFSPRPDTPLFNAKDRVPESVRDERAKILRTLSAELTDAYLRRQEGKQGEVIVQGRKGGFWCGVTGNYVDVRIVNPPLFAQRGMLLEGVFGKKADRFVEFIVTETS
ncbi:MAG: tRNA (N(6)-L-threonylcarbamoyladenosine(37)-C(2))-methylthiotransferase MtaB [Spirochaetales bacterium]|nr:tRNA (N(6)-L-threonylcarbamoyladenosine(37)-C(2))-methylthiotransferase MtaB [Spirochaetales bacterium]